MKELVFTQESIDMLADVIQHEMSTLASLHRDCHVPKGAKVVIDEELGKLHTLLDYILS